MRIRSLIAGAAALALVSSCAAMEPAFAATYPRTILKGAFSIVSAAEATKGNRTTTEVRRQLEAYLRTVNVSFPATFEDKADVTGLYREITVLRFDERFLRDGRSALNVIYVTPGNPREQSLTVYVANVRGAGL